MGYKRAINLSMQKKLMYLFLLLIVAIEVNAINIIPSTYETINSTQGILVQNTAVNQDKSITVTFKNVNSSNYDNSGEIITYSFEWYLSYKGKRVSDYYTDALRCGKTTSHTVYIWPGEVPSGYEKYITVQLGKEPKKTDRRDDSGAARY